MYKVFPKPKLVFIVSGWTCNAIYRNFNEAHAFSSAFPFQQAPTNVYISSRSPVTVGFVKTVAGTPPKKGNREMNENTNLFTHIILNFQGCTFDNFLEVLLFVRPIFLMVVSVLWNTSKDHLHFLNHLGIWAAIPLKK